MSRVRYDITAEIEVLSPLHVGTGEVEKQDAVKGKDGIDGPDVALLCKDINDKPYIAGSTLKGALRSLAGDDFEYAGFLFGKAKDSKKSKDNNIDKTIKDDDDGDNDAGNIGAMIFRGANLSEAASSEMPYAKDSKDGIFISVHTAINPQTGKAKEPCLYSREMLVPGCKFQVSFSLNCKQKTAQEDLRKALKLLVLATEKQGFQIGKSISDGFGRICLVSDTLEVKKYNLSALGFEEDKTFQNPWTGGIVDSFSPKLDEQKIILTMVCKGPFAVLDSSHTENKKQSKSQETASIKAQRYNAKKPLILGTSLSGVLRNRARWIKSLDNLDNIDSACPVDNPDKNVLTPKDAQSLTPIERLFGVTGFKALLQIKRLDVSEAKNCMLPGVKIDRFTGAPIDGALFSTNCFHDVHLHVDLSLDGKRDPNNEDKEMFAHLIEDICNNGITLGHGGNKGYGWFECKIGEE